MPRTVSKSQVDKLGERLRKSESLRTEDIELLDRVRREYLPSLREAQAVLQQIGLNPTPRPAKTLNTIIEKLRREKTRLSEMQDLAGLRVVREMSLSEQDEMVAEVRTRFAASRVHDRRSNPSYGYRAVHVILNIDDFPVELQIRTTLQHLWADYFEKLADRWGRQIRYGHPPSNPYGPGPLGTRQQTLDDLLEFSSDIQEIETGIPMLGFQLEQLAKNEPTEATATVLNELANAHRAHKASLEKMDEILRSLFASLE